jgi:hypothetical protein
MARRKKQIDPNEVRKLAMIGATIKEIASYVGCGHATIERRFMEEVEAGRAEGGIAAKGRIYKTGVLNGEYASLQLYLVNQCGWTIRPDIAVVNNVIQNAAPRRTPEQVKAHLVELQLAVWDECDRIEQQNRQLPPPAAGASPSAP